MLKELINSDTKLICDTLAEKGMLTIHDLEVITGYREMYIYLALGWLSKENKINYVEKNDDLYIELNT